MVVGLKDHTVPYFLHYRIIYRLKSFHKGSCHYVNQSWKFPYTPPTFIIVCMLLNMYIVVTSCAASSSSLVPQPLRSTSLSLSLRKTTLVITLHTAI